MTAHGHCGPFSQWPGAAFAIAIGKIAQFYLPTKRRKHAVRATGRRA